MSIWTGCLGSIPGSRSRKSPFAFIDSSFARNVSAERASFITTRRTTAPGKRGGGRDAWAWARDGKDPAAAPAARSSAAASDRIVEAGFIRGITDISFQTVRIHCGRKAASYLGREASNQVAIE